MVVAGCLLVAFTQKTNAQDAEKTKAIIYKMMDLDYRIAFIPANKDTFCRSIYATIAKDEFVEFSADARLAKNGETPDYTSSCYSQNLYGHKKACS